MSDAENLKDEQTQAAGQPPMEPEADGYYGEEDLEDGELDLSFLDEDEQDEATNGVKPAENK